MHSFSLDSTKAELARWANIPVENLPDSPDDVLLTSDSAYPVLSCAPRTGERTVVMAQLGPITREHAEVSRGGELCGDSSREPSAVSDIRQRPCLVPVRSFIAPRFALSGVAEPYSFARLSDDIVGLAGLLEERTAGATRLCIYSMLSTDSPLLLKPFFLRLPAIVDSPDYDSWLQWDGISQAAYSKVVRPLPSISLREWCTMPADKEHAVRDLQVLRRRA